MIQDATLTAKADSQYMSWESIDDDKTKNPIVYNKSMKDEEEGKDGEEPICTSLFGPDDKEADTTYFHSYNILGKMFIVPKNYELLKAVGKGSYGIVCKAKDKNADEIVAIKKMMNPFKIPGQIIRILREIRLLKFLNHENIIQIKDLFPAVSIKNFESIYLVTEFVSTDLMQIIHSDNSLSEEHIKFILFQILSALKYLHSANIIHRDLKPSNILINEDWEIKICDFGLARAMDTKEFGENSDMTMYVTTRIYRAPELLFNLGEYSTQIDVWSVGWIFAEMLIRKPLFMTKNQLRHVSMIINLVGNINELSSYVFSNYIPLFNQSWNIIDPSQTFDAVFKAHSEDAKDLLKNLLQIDPSRRITIDQALQHPYFSDYEDELEDLENCDRAFDTSFESLHNNPEFLKSEVLKEILSFWPNITDEQFSKHNSEYKFLRRSSKVHHQIK